MDAGRERHGCRQQRQQKQHLRAHAMASETLHACDAHCRHSGSSGSSGSSASKCTVRGPHRGPRQASLADQDPDLEAPAQGARD
jgi:hypothetical protein